MQLSAGTRLGPYEIGAPLGAGGMGEVYQARDTRLERTVAIKVSSEQFSERFQREARAVAALNHPHICTVHDVGPDYLVMEYIQGPTLAARVAGGPIPLPEALTIARQMAEALEAAHEKGIVHRDLKPSNIKLTHDGQVKVLDFGLASMSQTAPAGEQDPANSPTRTLASTRAGVILGTAGYMSPEQARGLAADRRADIWSFGVVLFEMLAGFRVFAGDTVSDTLAAVLRAELDWSALPPDTPAAIRRLLRRCLERDRNKRLHDIADARLEIDEALAAGPEPAPLRKRPWLAFGFGGLALLAAGWVGSMVWRPQPAMSAVRSAVLPPEKASFTPLAAQAGGVAVSPDGRTLAFVATQEGKTLLWVRRLDSLNARPLAGTEGAYYPFWSPDNRFLGFFAENKLEKIEVAGGPPQVLCSAHQGRGGTWSPRGIIVFSATDRTLHRVPASGGEPVQITTLDPAYQENAHYWPSFLPDGRHFVYLSRSSVREKSAICAGSVDGKPGPEQRREIVKASSNAAWSGGWLLFLRDTALLAQKFDASALKLEGDAVPVAEHVGYLPNTVLANFSVSAAGELVYGREIAQDSRLTWVSRDGKQSAAAVEQGIYEAPRLSPDAGRLAIDRTESPTGNTDVFVVDLAHSISTRFTFDPAIDVNPLWSPDGRRIVFASAREGNTLRLFVKPSSGAGVEVRLTQPAGTQLSYDWSRDGRYLLYSEVAQATGFDLWVLPAPGAPGDRKPTPFLQTPAQETQGQFSPDSRWIAYTSNESGRPEVYVRSFTGEPAKFQISTSGGVQPRWRGDGKELYYLSPDGKLMAAAMRAAADALERETPRPLFEARWMAGAGAINYIYDVTRDGQRFLFVERVDPDVSEPLALITNWQSLLRR